MSGMTKAEEIQVLRHLKDGMRDGYLKDYFSAEWILSEIESAILNDVVPDLGAIRREGEEMRERVNALRAVCDGLQEQIKTLEAKRGRLEYGCQVAADEFDRIRTTAKKIVAACV